MESCLFYPDIDCDRKCSIEYHNTSCTLQQCTIGSAFEETFCYTTMECNGTDSRCFIEKGMGCRANRYSFHVSDFCDIKTDIIRVQCGNDKNLITQLLLENKDILCQSIPEEKVTLANCECKTCSGDQCVLKVATYCSCISPHGHQQMTTISHPQPTEDHLAKETSGSSALIGGILGCVVGVALVALLVLVVLWYRRKNRSSFAEKRHSRAHENKVYQERNIQFQRNSGSTNMYDEVNDIEETWRKTNLKTDKTIGIREHHSVLSTGKIPASEKNEIIMSEESDYNKLYERSARNLSKDEDEQYDHVDSRNQSENMGDYDQLNKFSDTRHGDPNDDYDHCRTIHPQHRTKSLEIPDDDYDHLGTKHHQ